MLVGVYSTIPWRFFGARAISWIIELEADCGSIFAIRFADHALIRADLAKVGAAEGRHGPGNLGDRRFFRVRVGSFATGSNR